MLLRLLFMEHVGTNSIIIVTTKKVKLEKGFG